MRILDQDHILTPEEYRWRTTRLKRYLRGPLNFVEGLRHRLQPVANGRNRALRVAAWRQFLDTCLMIDEFNRDAALLRNQPGLAPQLQSRTSAGLWRLGDGERLPAQLRTLIALRSTAAVLAARLDATFGWAQFRLFVFLGAAVGFFDVYDHSHAGEVLDPGGKGGHHHHPFYLVLVFLFIGLGVLDVVRVHYQRTDARRLDYRALAEAVRVRLYWAAAGLGVSVADSYLGQLRGEISWARLTLKILAPPPPVWSEAFRHQAREHQVEQLLLVKKEWVDGQLAYYRQNVRRRDRRSRGFKTAGLTFAGASVLFAASCLVIPIAYRLAGLGPVDYPPDVLLVASNVSLVIGALLLVYNERESNEDLAKQYERMAEVFHRASTELKDALTATPPDIATAQGAIHALGNEAISEHSQWLILRRNRPFEVPVP